jgi:[ribosomal protein S5]-alanine N-acetyltransferase
LVLLQNLKRDGEEFIQLALNSRRFHHPWIQPASTPESYAAYLKYSRRRNVRSFLICRSQDSRILGVCTLSQIFQGNFQSAYFGYWIGKEFSGQGYMREALQIVLQYSFDTLRLHRIEANIQPGNMRSKALVSCVGFRLEGFSPRYLKVLGRWRDHERFAICREKFSERVKRLDRDLTRR